MHFRLLLCRISALIVLSGKRWRREKGQPVK